MKLPSLQVRNPIARDLLIFTAFLAVTVLITWPWVLQLRNGVPDIGDPYSISYFLWWDYHQTFRDPFNLFHATIFYPYRYTLAFGEYDYGVSLLFFPLFALGVRPLTIYSIAAFLSFPFTAYGTFRLARTLSGSSVVGWIAGIVLAFVPFRFHHLAHLHLIFAGWIPLLFEALVLYARKYSWKRAAWLGLTFLMNGLTCTTWLLLTAIPLTLSGLLLVSRHRLWKQRNFWLRAIVTLGLAALLLLPFLLPYRRVAELYGFGRSAAEVLTYSARPINWLAAEPRNKLWGGMAAAYAQTEMFLFPGILAPLLALAAFLLGSRSAPGSTKGSGPSLRARLLLASLDTLAVVSGVIALAAWGYNGFKIRAFGTTLLSVSSSARPLLILVLALVVRCLIAYPQVIQNALRGEQSLRHTLNSKDRSELMGHALLWLIVGFLGSFGLNAFFHTALYDFVPLFASMRVAARWAMIAYVGLALLAGVGVVRFVGQFAGARSQKLKPTLYVVLTILVLCELNVAPLQLIRGAVDPDPLALFLKEQKMVGGIVELPAGDRNHVYMLRAADHGHPLVNANDSFVSPLSLEVERLTNSPEIPERFLDLLEESRVSFVTVHNSFLTPESRIRLETFIRRAISTGRLRFIKSFDNPGAPGSQNRNDLYAVTAVEPKALGDGSSTPSFFQPVISFLGPADKLRPSGQAICHFYRLLYGRLPSYAEFSADLPRAVNGENLHLAEMWLRQPDVSKQVDSLSNEQFVKRITDNADVPEAKARAAELLEALQQRRLTRGEILQTLAEEPAFVEKELQSTFILLQYFLYLRRDPDEGGQRFWLTRLNESGDYKGVNEAFANSPEHK